MLFRSLQTATRTFSISGAKTVHVFAQDDKGFTSAWSPLSFNCSGVSAVTGVNGSDNGAGTGLGNGAGTVPPLPDLSIRAIPSLIRVGGTTKLNWSATNVGSCTVSAPNGDFWNTLESLAGGGNVSKPINHQITYTLSCVTSGGGAVTKSATINVLPSFIER